MSSVPLRMASKSNNPRRSVIPYIILNGHHTIPEPGKDRRAQAALWASINELCDAFEAGIAKLGGASAFDHARKREPGKRDLTPPPATQQPSQPVDLVTIAEIGASVSEAARPVEPIAGTAPRHKAA